MNGFSKNFDALLKIAAKDLVEEDYEIAQSIDTSNTVISEKRLKKSRRKIKNYDKESLWLELPIACRRVVAAVLILCTMSFSLCLGVEAIRVEIVNTVIQWYEQFVAVFYVSDMEAPDTIEEYREPALQISGTERHIVSQGELTYQIYYIADNEIVLAYHQDVMNNQSHDFDSEYNCTQKKIEINDYDANLFMYEDGTQSITWHDNNYSYLIHSLADEIETETLVLIAESVK